MKLPGYICDKCNGAITAGQRFIRITINGLLTHRHEKCPRG